jgi:aminocarboxymuconate-semialdehyde decarboxylase
MELPVMIHPDFTYDKHPSLAPWYLNNVIGLPLETTLTVERLICAGVLDRHPQARVMLVHAGGFFPYQAGRLRHARTVRPDLAQSPEDPWEFLSQLWFDCITHDRQALRYLVERVGPAHVVMGTDLPFDMALPDPIQALAAAVDSTIVDQIARTNPAQLFRLGVKPSRNQAAA